MQSQELQSYVRFMNEHLFDHIDIPAENVHVPDGSIPVDDVAEYCRNYEQQIVDAGGIDIQILGIGSPVTFIILPLVVARLRPRPGLRSPRRIRTAGG